MHLWLEEAGVPKGKPPPSVASKRFKLKTMHQCNSANNYTTVMLTQYFLEEIPMQQSEILKKVLKSS